MKTKKKDEKIYLYAAREISSGKLVSNLVNPRRKYWDRQGNAESAVRHHNTRVYRGWENAPGQCEVVKFELIEVPKTLSEDDI